MVQQENSKALVPFDFNALMKEIPEIKKIKAKISTLSFKTPLDSSCIQPKNWLQMAEIIVRNYTEYDGFVILHGTDTMAYTASALSFILENLNKPVVLTGSQLPIGTLRTDAKENLLTAIEIASLKDASGIAKVPEVSIYFEYSLYRGNRSTKTSADNFRAFRSPNYPKLGESGVDLNIFSANTQPSNNLPLIFNSALNNNITSLKLYPGITKEAVTIHTTLPNLRAIIIETFGAGNAPDEPWFINLLYKATQKDIIILNISQCSSGKVQQGKYATSTKLSTIGVISGGNMTFEAAITKLMYLLGSALTTEEIKERLLAPICGEMD